MYKPALLKVETKSNKLYSFSHNHGSVENYPSNARIFFSHWRYTHFPRKKTWLLEGRVLPFKGGKIIPHIWIISIPYPPPKKYREIFIYIYQPPNGFIIQKTQVWWSWMPPKSGRRGRSSGAEKLKNSAGQPLVENDHDDEGHGGFDGVYLYGWLSWFLFFWCFFGGKGRKSWGLAGYCKNAAILLFIWEILLREFREILFLSLFIVWFLASGLMDLWFKSVNFFAFRFEHLRGGLKLSLNYCTLHCICGNKIMATQPTPPNVPPSEIRV